MKRTLLYLLGCAISAKCNVSPESDVPVKGLPPRFCWAGGEQGWGMPLAGRKECRGSERRRHG